MAVLNEEQIAQFWREIKKFKEISNVQIERIDGLDNSRKKKKGNSRGQAITPLNIRLSLKADMAQSLKFMNLFENFERLVTINSVSMTVARTGVDESVDDKAVRHNVDELIAAFRNNRLFRCDQHITAITLQVNGHEHTRFE